MMNFAFTSPCSSKAKSIPSASVAFAYVLLIVSGSALYHFVAAKEISSVLTIAAMVQSFALALLGMQVVSAGHVRGISARALALEALALICRLSNTAWLDGYLPVDASGDWMYQAVDVCSLALVFWLMYQVVVVHKDTYHEADDTFPAVHMALGAVVLASLFHPDMNDFPFFDSLWMAGLNISAIAVLPQLWLTSRVGGRMEALTTHYIAAMAVSQVLNGIFVWHAWDHITCQPWIQGVNHGPWAMAFAHLVQTLLIGDFAYYYIRSLVKEGLSSSMDLGNALYRSSIDSSSHRGMTMPCPSAPKSIPSASVVAAYVLLILSGATVYHFIAAKEISSFLTIGAMVQVFAFSLLGMQVASARHGRGISARALALEALALLCRLSNTVWLDGYLPVDASGDWMYQAVDVCSLALVLWLIYQVVVVHKDTYQGTEDTFPAAFVALGAVVLACIFHPDMNDFPFFDSLWMAGLNISSIAVLPQLWLTSRVGGRMEALTTHFVAAMAISQFLKGMFVWHAWDHITCQPWIQGVNHGPWATAFAHVVHVILVCDFAYYYIRSLVKDGVSSNMDFGNAICGSSVGSIGTSSHPSPCSSTANSIPSASVVVAYVLLILSGATMYHFVGTKEVSSYLTIGAMVQAFAFALLGMQVASARHARGISARALALDALALICRLSNTVWLDGYLPVDASGDWMYQAADICSLALVLWLVYQVVVVHKGTYQEAEDTFPAFQAVLGAVVLACIFHPDMNDFPFFDSLWMAGLNISAIAVLPQLWLTSRVGGRMEALTSHYVAAMATSQFLNGMFMWHAWDHVTCQPWIQGVNHGVLAMAFAHLVHMFLLVDFAYYYIRSLVKGGISSSMDLGSAVWV